MKKPVTEAIEQQSAMPEDLRKGLAAAYIAFITLLSLLPARTFRTINSPFESFDKVVHALMYGVMAFILCWAAQPGKPKSTAQLTGIVTFCALQGMAMEICQLIFPALRRSFSWEDELFNIAGAFVSVLVWKATEKRL